MLNGNAIRLCCGFYVLLIQFIREVVYCLSRSENKMGLSIKYTNSGW